MCISSSFHFPLAASPKLPDACLKPIEKTTGQEPNIYIVKEELSRKERLHHFIAGLGTFILTLGFGLGLGFFSSRLRQKISIWFDECKTGIRQVKHIKTTPLATDTEIDNIDPIKTETDAEKEILCDEDTLKFIDKARKQLPSLSSLELERGLEKALKFGKNLNPDEKTTLLTVSEKVSEFYIKKNQFNKAFEIRLQAAQCIPPTPLLANIHLNIHKAHPKLGLHIQSLGTSLFKNHALTIQKREYGQNMPHQIHLFTKLHHPARAQIQSTLNRIQSHPKELFNALPAGFCTDITVKQELCHYQGCAPDPDNFKDWEGHFSRNREYGFTLRASLFNKPIQVIEFKGVGKIKIGNDPNIRAEYNKLAIELDPGIPLAQTAAKINILFATLGLGTVSSTSRSEDIERIKVLQLFRGYYPKEAYSLEREAKSFEESVESLKVRIEAKVPEMKKKFQHYLIDHPDLMYQQEIFPGQFAWCIKGLAQEAREAGAVGLMAGIDSGGLKETIQGIISILKIGALSTQDRFQAGITTHGMSSVEDLRSGGGDSVFTRIFTQGMQNITNFTYQGKMQILYDLDLIERVGFAFSHDKFGTKVPAKYQDRPNIVDLVKKIETKPKDYLSNEVCLPHRVPPQYIKAIKVNSEEDKSVFIAALKAEGLVTYNAAQQEIVNGILLSKFIVVGPYYKAEYWN